MPNNKILLPLIALVILAGGFVGGISFQKTRLAPASLAQAITNQDTGKPDDVDFSSFWKVWSLLQQNFVDKSKLKSQDLVYGAINGMVDAVGDPYTTFFKPEENKQFSEQIKGAFGGVGIELGQKTSILTVVAPIKDSPAQRAGILAGDKIIRIDGKITLGMKVSDAVNLIRGANGTAVVLTIARDSLKDPKDFRLIREVIKIPAVEWEMLDGNVAYLQVYVFNENVDPQFKKAAQEIANSPAKKIILDLRNNPGGFLESSIDLAGYFLDANSVVTIQREGDGKETIYRTENHSILKTYPLLILLNKGSASASEILAGALRDDRSATIIGETSFGKGSVQNVFSLDHGTSVKITFAKWFTPSNISINENGIKPDIEVKLSDDDLSGNRDPQLDRARELIKNL